MSIVINCPKCEIRLTFGDDRAGENLECPKCSNWLKVPSPSTPKKPSDSIPIHFLCPRCRASMRIAGKKVGTEVNCLKCGQLIIVPEPLIKALVGIPIDPFAPKPLPIAKPTRPAPKPLPLPPPAPDRTPAVSRPIPLFRRRPRSGIVDAVGWMHIVIGVINIIFAAIILLAALGIASVVNAGFQAITAAIGTIIAIFFFALSIPDFIAANGIFKRREWGRIFALVMAGINGIFAIGSLLHGDICFSAINGACSIFSFIVLFNKDYAKEFKQPRYSYSGGY
jgi:DNA-directed RNA polymerase subunit M/transcription elongation factor TFIIS